MRKKMTLAQASHSECHVAQRQAKACRTWLVIVATALINTPVAAQKRFEPPVSQLCSRSNALGLIEQQASASKTNDNVAQRIGVLTRAADLMWPYQQAKSRALFTEAFDLATLDFKEKGEQTTRMGRLPVEVPDLRFTVIRAVAKRDVDWARKLSEQALQDTQEESDDAAKDRYQSLKSAEKLLAVADSLIKSHPISAVMIARSSLRYIATLHLPSFLYRLAEQNKPLADSFYVEALAAYANSPMDQFLYLSSYPFANNRDAGEMPSYMFYQVPANVTPNPTLQRPFMQALLRQAQLIGQDSPEAKPGTSYSEAAQIWMALSRLENQVQSSLSDLGPALQEAKGSMFVLMSQKDQQRTAGMLVELPRRTFAEQIEAAEKQSDPGQREGGIALAILGVTPDEPLENVVAAANKLDDQNLRSQVLSAFYFTRAQTLVKKKELQEARKLASKVDGLDHRAYLYSLIVMESIKLAKNDAEIREILEEVLTVAEKAPNGEVKARALLALAHLFSKVDSIRSIGVMSEAIKTINQIENPDFSREYVLTKIEGKEFGYYSSLSTPGFNPENAFREMSQFDFDGLLYQSGQFSNKSLRSMTTLALVEPCLQQTGPAKARPSKPKP